MLLRVWSDQPYRATRDLDQLWKGDGSFEAIGDGIRTISVTPVEKDAVVYADAIRIDAIRAEDEYVTASDAAGTLRYRGFKSSDRLGAR